MNRLILEQQICGWRHFIAGEEVCCGDRIEILLGDSWIAGRYEAQGLGNPTTSPIATLEIDNQHYIKLIDNVPARWPGQRS